MSSFVQFNRFYEVQRVNFGKRVSSVLGEKAAIHCLCSQCQPIKAFSNSAIDIMNMFTDCDKLTVRECSVIWLSYHQHFYPVGHRSISK